MRALGWMLLILACLAAGAAAAHAEEATLDGMYASEGVNADGKPYRGLVAIERHGENFIVRWIFARVKNGDIVFEQTWIGVGIASGGVLAVSYYAPDDAGVVVYRIEKGGRTLIGLWAALGDVGAVSKETLTRLEEDVPMPPVELPPVTPEPAPVTPGPLRTPAGAAL